MSKPESLIEVKEGDVAAPAKTVRPDADVIAETQEAIAAAAVGFHIKVLTVNIHKGFTFFNRKFILPELRDAVRKVGADVVFLQEVTGTNVKHTD